MSEATAFALQAGIDDDLAEAAFEIFEHEMTAPRKTLAHRAGDLAEALRRLGVDEQAVHAAVCALATERRR